MKTTNCSFSRILLIITLNVFLGLTSKAQSPQSGWSFSYPGDNFTDDALLDLSYLNEDVAGEKGFIRLSEDGNSFVDGAGKPLRLWSINGGGLANRFSMEEMEKYAKFLAKMGVNMIRFHGSVNPAGKGTKITDVDTKDVEAIWKMVATMKKEGIYSTISPFWAHNGHMGGWLPEEWGIEGYSEKDDLWGVMFFSDTLKAGYKAWVKYLYSETNPYTGIALKDDPSVGIIQVKNEDGLFFWTVSGIKEPIKKVIRQKFYKWLVDKYGNINKAKSAWNNVSLKDDNPEAGEMDIYGIWEATQERTDGMQKRISDQIEFMAKVQRDFYQEMHDYYRSLGCKQLVNGNNWKTANSARLLDIERWTNAACEVIALNRYNDPGHRGPNDGWRIDPGDTYQGKSVLVEPNKLPINIKHPEGHPIMVTESGWNLPHKYQAEGPFLISAYMSLTGVDGYYWFAQSSASYDENPFMTWANLEGGQHPLSRWTMSTPGQLGMFPANALLYRLGYLKEGKITVYEERTLQSMWERKIPVVTEEMGFDPNRDTFVSETDETKISPLAYLTGKVFVKYGADDDKNDIAPELNKLIDFAAKTVTSSTNELKWDYQDGICVMDAPKAQGVCGFVGKKGTYELQDIIIETANDYAAINVVSLDEKDIVKSSKILVQVGTVYQPDQWKETPIEVERNGNKSKAIKIENTGKMPWKCANTEVNLKINNSGIKKATALDAAGYAKAEVELKKEGKGVTLKLPEDAMYVVLED